MLETLLIWGQWWEPCRMLKGKEVDMSSGGSHLDWNKLTVSCGEKIWCGGEISLCSLHCFGRGGCLQCWRGGAPRALRRHLQRPNEPPAQGIPPPALFYSNSISAIIVVLPDTHHRHLCVTETTLVGETGCYSIIRGGRGDPYMMLLEARTEFLPRIISAVLSQWSL